MKRILSGGLVFLCFFWCVDLVFGSAINSLTIGKRQAVSSPANVVYRGTLTDLRISSVDGTAFIDNAGTVPTYADGNHQISIFDSSGRELRGVLKAAGEGAEGLGSELMTNGDFSSADGWTLPTGFRINGGKLIKEVAADSGAYAYRSITKQLGALYKSSLDVEAINGGSTTFVLTGDPIYMFPLTSTIATHTGYATAALTNHHITGPFLGSPDKNNATGQWDNASLKQVTAPSSSGATIVSTKGGTTQNFTQKNSSFTYNASSYYVIVRKMP